MCDPIQSDVLGVNPESLVGVTSFHVCKRCIWLVIVFGRYALFSRVGAAAVGPAVNIGCIFWEALGFYFLCLFLLLLLRCCCRVFGIWDCLWFELVVGVGFGQELRRLGLLALFVYCCDLILCTHVKVQLIQLSLVPGVVRIHVGQFMKNLLR